MDKNVLKKFAIESRQELMEKVANKIILKTENVTKATRLLERFMRKYTTPKGLFKIATINRKQTENEINKQIYIKADNIVRILKVEKIKYIVSKLIPLLIRIIKIYNDNKEFNEYLQYFKCLSVFNIFPDFV